MARMAAPESGDKASKTWAAVKPGLVLGLKATEMALDGLPIPGVKGCISAILQFIDTADVASENIDTLKALQTRLDNLQRILQPVYANKTIDVPEDVRIDVESLSQKLDELAANWEPKLDKKPKKKWFKSLRRLLNAKDNTVSLTRFVTMLDQTIQDFLVLTTTNGRIAAFREHIKTREARALDSLPRAPTAAYDSVRTGGPNACLKGTRATVLETIRDWARALDPNQPPLFWLNGLAGIGKTTIAHTVAAELDEAGLLGGSFVFVRADDQLKDARLVFPTIAFQLAHHNPEFRHRLVDILDHNPDYGSKQLDIQFDTLILQPFSSVPLARPLIVLLDALDECDPVGLAEQLLHIIHGNIHKVPFLRIFITSRPEGYIREALDHIDENAPHQKLILHQGIYVDEARNDIRHFLQTRLQEIWNKRTGNVSGHWPSDYELSALVKQSGKLFIYAATAVRFIGGNRSLDLDRQLRIILNVEMGHVPSGEPYRQLDSLYLQILQSAFADLNADDDDYYVERFQRIVGSMVLLQRPFPLHALAKFMGPPYTTQHIRDTLYHLHSVIIVPESDDEPLRTYHLSFPDFITNSKRCTYSKAWIDPSQQAKYLFLRCVDIVKEHFGPRSVDSDSASVLGSGTYPLAQLWTDIYEVSRPPPWSCLPAKANRSDEYRNWGTYKDELLALEVQYSERHWWYHLMKTTVDDTETVEAFEQFIRNYFETWIDYRLARMRRLLTGGWVRPEVSMRRWLIRDTLEIVYDAYDWATSARCDGRYLSILVNAGERFQGITIAVADSLKVTDKAVNGLSIQGLKECMEIILNVINGKIDYETTWVIIHNLHVFEAIQNQVERLQELLDATKNIPLNMRRHVEILDNDLRQLVMKSDPILRNVYLGPKYDVYVIIALSGEKFLGKISKRIERFLHEAMDTLGQPAQ